MKEKLSRIPTEEEQYAYYLVKGFVCGLVDLDRVKINKTQNYCGIILDKAAKTLCCLTFGPRVKSLRVFDTGIYGRPLERITRIDDLQRFQKQFQQALQRLLP